ncbi:Protein of unknown function [Duganella sp. CF517]|nr:Protein of unknown function [Duganella sp. CF517]
MRCGSCNEVFDGNAALLEPLAIPQPVFAPVVSEAPYFPPPTPAPFDEAVAAPDPRALEPAGAEPIYTLELDSAVDETAPEWQSGHEPAIGPEPAIQPEVLPEPEADAEPESDVEPEADAERQAEAGVEPEPFPAEEQRPPVLEPAPDDPLAIEPMTHEELEAALAAELALMEQDIAAGAAEQEAKAAPSTAAADRQEPTLDPDSRYDLDEADEEALVQLAAARERDSAPQLHTLLRAASAPSQDHFAPQAEVHSVEPPAPEAVEAEVDDPNEPGFLKRDRRRERYGKTINIAMGVGSLLLAGALAAQGLTTFRNQLAASYPGLKPTLQDICAALGCKIELPTRIDELVIEQGELQTLSETTFSFTTLLRNQGATAQQWPHIELVLDDANDKAILRRVFTPRDYLGADAAPEKGFAPRSEQSVKLYFELKQLKASGYHIAVFYP